MDKFDEAVNSLFAAIAFVLIAVFMMILVVGLSTKKDYSVDREETVVGIVKHTQYVPSMVVNNGVSPDRRNEVFSIQPERFITVFVFGDRREIVTIDGNNEMARRFWSSFTADQPVVLVLRRHFMEISVFGKSNGRNLTSYELTNAWAQ